jgi:hypothetical protein
MVSDHTVTFSGHTVTVGSQTWDAPWPVRQAATVGDRVVLLYDYMAAPTDRQFRNLEAFTVSGERLWTAEHPTSEPADCYVEILATDPLIIWDFAGYRCTIDPSNGRLIDAEFTK